MCGSGKDRYSSSALSLEVCEPPTNRRKARNMGVLAGGEDSGLIYIWRYTEEEELLLHFRFRTVPP